MDFARTPIRKVATVAASFLAGILIAYLFRAIGLRDESIFMTFILIVMVAVIMTHDVAIGVVLGILFVLGFNFLFAAPRFELVMYDANYYVSFAVFIVVTLIVNALATKLQNETLAARRNELMQRKLFDMSEGYLNLAHIEDIADYTRDGLEEQLGKPVSLRLVPPDGGGDFCASGYGYGADGEAGEEQSQEASIVSFPIGNIDRMFGIIDIGCQPDDVDEYDQCFAETVASLASLSMERAYYEEETRSSQVAMEHERFKNTLLRSVSHDLRTPLTSIAGGAGFLVANSENADAEVVKGVASDIESDALWLSHMVDNLLAMTRVQDDDVKLNQKNEVVDDILSDAVSRTIKRRGKHDLKVRTPDDVVLVYADGQLITQVLVNLIDNAFKHTREDSVVVVSARREGEGVVFEVSDDGGGLKADGGDNIFESFNSQQDGDRSPVSGIGLGLSICKAIVSAHGGTISVENNSAGGATFSFSLPVANDKAVEEDE